MNTLRTLLLAFALAAAAVPAARAASLYTDLGGLDTIRTFVGRTVDLAFTDPRIAKAFAHSKRDYLKKMITQQVCDLSGGPCRYNGLTMKKAHVGMGLTTADFNALVELLQQAMRESHISYHTQNRLLAILAPMHRDVVEK
ncbi:MAG: group 1 truncated hemoglobin [Alphaproteobacteria bacterium]|nr:group 1 truncated hemoglobin [Alphaproteobacteria bacterium]